MRVILSRYPIFAKRDKARRYILLCRSWQGSCSPVVPSSSPPPPAVQPQASDDDQQQANPCHHPRTPLRHNIFTKTTVAGRVLTINTFILTLPLFSKPSLLHCPLECCVCSQVIIQPPARKEGQVLAIRQSHSSILLPSSNLGRM